MTSCLAPLSWLYGAAVEVRRRWYARDANRSRSLARPVVSVGNVAVGGTGKTPVVIALAEALTARGVGVTVLSRGYRGAGERNGALVSNGRDGVIAGWKTAGDEPVLIARRVPRAAVIVGRNRLESWRRYADGIARGVVILDDGFQHFAIARDHDIVLVDATDDPLRAALLPRGRLREPWTALARANTVMITRVEQREAASIDAVERFVRVFAPRASVLRVRFDPERLDAMADGTSIGLERLRDTPVVAAAGIARFDTFVGGLERLGARVVDRMAFRDHHPFARTDVERIAVATANAGAHAVVTTEKDAVKLHEAVDRGDPPFWVLRIRARVSPEAEWDELIERLAARARP